MKRIIKYIPKNTLANTEYRSVNEVDMAFIHEQILRYLSRMGELDMEHEGDLYDLNRDWWHKRRKTLPKGRQGANTPCSYIAGMANNLIWGDQRDLSNKQMDALEEISLWMAECFPNDFSAIRFQIGFEQ